MADITHPDIIPDNDPRTVNQVVADATPPSSKLNLLKTGTRPGSSSRRQSTKDEPPKKVRGSQRPAPEHVPGEIEEGFTGLYTQIGMFWGMVDQTCGLALVEQAPKMAASLEHLAEKNPAVRNALMKVITGSVWGEVISAHLPLAVTVYAHHMRKPKPAPVEDAEVTAENAA